MKKFRYMIVSFLLTMTLLPSISLAAPLPFMPSKDENKEIKPVSSDEFLGGILGGLDGFIAPAYKWGITIITFIFIIGTVAMVLAVIFKNGQWQKYGQGTMLISFVVMIALRGLPIIILSIQNMNDMDVLLNNTLTFVSGATIFVSLIGVGASLLFRFKYRLIEHPDFYRWSRTLLTISILMMVFAVAIPVIFPTI